MKRQKVMACGMIMVVCFVVVTAQAADGLVLKASLDKAVYEPGETITLSLEAHNEGAQRIDVVHSELNYQLVLDGKPYRFNLEQDQSPSGKVTRSREAGAVGRQFMVRSTRLEPGQAPLTLTLPLSGTLWLTAQTREALVMRPGDHVVYVATASASTPMPVGPMRVPQGRGPGMLRAMPRMPMPQGPGMPRELPAMPTRIPRPGRSSPKTATPMPQSLSMPRAWPAMASAVSEPVFFKIVGDANVLQSLYYGKAVFEDGSAAVVPALSLKPFVCMGSEDGGNAAHLANVGDDGTFVMALTPQEVSQINQKVLSLGAIFAPSVRRISLLSKESSLIALGSLGQSLSDPGVVKVARPPVYYGRILYEDGTVPSTPTGRNWMFGVSVGAPMSLRMPGNMGLDEEGYFAMFVSADQMERMKARDGTYPIFNGPPTPDDSGRRTRKPVSKFPLALLSLDKAKAGVVKIPEPGVGG